MLCILFNVRAAVSFCKLYTINAWHDLFLSCINYTLIYLITVFDASHTIEVKKGRSYDGVA